MIVRTPSERPVELPISCVDRKVVDACERAAASTLRHQFPILVAVGAEPVAAVIMPFIGEADGDPIIGEGPELLDQPIVELLCPFRVRNATISSVR